MFQWVVSGQKKSPKTCFNMQGKFHFKTSIILYCAKVMQTPADEIWWNSQLFDKLLSHVLIWMAWTFGEIFLEGINAPQKFWGKINFVLWGESLYRKFVVIVQSSLKDLVEFVVCCCVMQERKMLKSIPWTELFAHESGLQISLCVCVFVNEC